MTTGISIRPRRLQELVCGIQSHETVNDIPMLIDTGADMTFVPKFVANGLDLQLSSDEGYTLKAYDGSTSLAAAVKADMLFLGRTFKGLYLVRESEIGILGRDVLNYFVMELDGPHLSWRQQTNSLK